MNLDDKYTRQKGSVYLTGIQALVRLPMDQMRRDRLAGLHTGTFISGYEGSPLGGYDLALERVPHLLKEQEIHFNPGVNEDLAATSVFGSQIIHVMGEKKFDGILGIWYGKGPGVDRSGDIFRHANIAGTGPNCAALALGGDDHLSKSSTIPHQSDFSFMNVGMPLFYPGSTQEILDFGLYAIALSRFCGAWSAMKMVTNVCDGGGTAEVDPDRLSIRIPPDYEKIHDARLVIPYTLMLEFEVNYRRLEAARAFARLNRLNRISGARDAWLGIATAGKPYQDLQQAFRDLGLRPEEHGIRVAKLGMTFPLEPEFVAEFARGLRTILVIEEKRSFLELQLRDALYNAAERPQIIGKQDAAGAPLFMVTGEIDPEDIAKVLGKVLGDAAPEGLRRRLAWIAEIEGRQRERLQSRAPNFCSGCPHNRSTIVLEGQAAGGGIGCHAMAATLSHSGRGYNFLTQMGGEGAPWIGMSPFLERKHMFQNIGDGTYFHSGRVAVAAAVAAGVNITYKILYNGTVAMTGGQDAAGALPVPDLTRKLEAEGVRKTYVLSDDLEKYDGQSLASNATLRSRDDLAGVMRELERIPGVTVIIYDQMCAAEKRRLRSRGKIEEPSIRLVIHEEVCEGCGDCVRQSNCMSLYPVETEYGQKTRIHQSSCNKDYSCALGDCPSFITVQLKPGTGQKKRAVPELPETAVGEPASKVAAGEGYAILAPGIGGTGVVTINALLATAAWLDGVSAITLDQTGLAQKGGAVLSSVILSDKPVEAAAKVGYGNADLILGFDILGAAAADTLKRAHPDRTVAVVNTNEVPTGDSIRGKIPLAGPAHAIGLIDTYTRRGRNLYVDATRLAEGLFASHLAVNVFLLGVAYQAGLIPLTAGSIEASIRLNRVEMDRNLQAFLWGRKYYADAAAVEALLDPPAKSAPDTRPLAERRAADLAAYQNAAYASQYTDFVSMVAARAPQLEETVARYLYKLMAYKDEYEVARLLTKPEFRERLDGMWEQVEQIRYNLHPPLLRSLGFKKKWQAGPWFAAPLRLLASLKFLRGTALDPFGRFASRREEHGLIVWYRSLIGQVLDKLTPENAALATEIASLPDQIRGYEQIKSDSVARVKALATEKLAELSRLPVLTR
jgi:indolepyruvate ferredoxin oxidoreductase